MKKLMHIRSLSWANPKDPNNDDTRIELNEVNPCSEVFISMKGLLDLTDGYEHSIVAGGAISVSGTLTGELVMVEFDEDGKPTNISNPTESKKTPLL